MKADAEKHAEADEKKKQEIQAVNEIEGVSYGMQKFVDDNKDKLTQELLTQTEQLRAKCDEAITNKQLELFPDLIKEIQQHSQKLGEHVAAQQTDQSADHPDAKDNKRDEAEDADFEVVGDDK